MAIQRMPRLRWFIGATFSQKAQKPRQTSETRCENRMTLRGISRGGAANLEKPRMDT
jgi:hypothetical protein